MLTYQITKNKSKKDILSMSLVGVEFEFYSNLSIEDTADSLAKLLNKKIRVEDKAHSDFIPTEREFKLEPDMSGGKGLVELVTAAIDYDSARLMIIRVLDWISTNGYTTKKSSIHLNISFDPKKTGINGLVSKMDPLKFVLEFGEREVYKMFPNRKDSVYAKSIKWIMPRLDANYFDGQYINPHVFDFAKEKYYGVNFKKLQKGYLEFRYIGGEDYEKKSSNILYLLDKFVLQLWHCANNGKYTDLNLIELKRILNKNNHLVEILNDHTKLSDHYDITLLVDLMDNKKIIDLHWPKIRKKVIKLISHAGLTKGFINYDSDIGRIQVKNAELTLCFGITEYDFVDCKISGTLEFCDFFRCQMESANILRCNLYQGTDIIDSKLESCYVNQSCEVKNSFVFKWDSVFKGRMIGGIFRHGKIGKEAEFDGTEIIQSKKII
tara:strand:+ start:7489 stop:8799 length:1311 start_codon:yes stop_codon:yes gene_type:complete